MITSIQFFRFKRRPDVGEFVGPHRFDAAFTSLVLENGRADASGLLLNRMLDQILKLAIVLRFWDERATRNRYWLPRQQPFTNRWIDIRTRTGYGDGIAAFRSLFPAGIGPLQRYRPHQFRLD